MNYEHGIPTKPGLYWYRESLESDAIICMVTVGKAGPKPEFISLSVNGWEVHTPDYEQGFFCSAIAPKVSYKCPKHTTGGGPCYCNQTRKEK